jgi:hypothetical protein
MDRRPTVPDRVRETEPPDQVKIPEWAREHAQGVYSRQTIIEQRTQIVTPDRRLAAPYDYYGSQGGYQYQQAPSREYFVRYYGQPGSYQGGYDNGCWSQYQQYYWRQYQQYYWQQYQNYYWQQYYRGGQQQWGDWRGYGGCGCGCGGSACGGAYRRYPQQGWSYRQDGGYWNGYQERYEQERYWEQRRYDPRYDRRPGQDVRETWRYEQNPFWPRLKTTIDSMVGHSIREYDPRIPENLGCARFVSAAVQRAYGLPITDAGVTGLERSLKKHGFVAVPFDQAQPGDVIIAHRRPGEKGHAAIYYGDGQIANNASYKRRIVVESANKFDSPEYVSVKAYRRVS